MANLLCSNQNVRRKGYDYINGNKLHGINIPLTSISNSLAVPHTTTQGQRYKKGASRELAALNAKWCNITYILRNLQLHLPCKLFNWRWERVKESFLLHDVKKLEPKSLAFLMFYNKILTSNSKADFAYFFTIFTWEKNVSRQKFSLEKDFFLPP